MSFILFLQCFLAAFAFAGISSAAGHTGNETDRLALLAFKSGIKEDPYGILKSWNKSQHFCHWHGVTCGRLHQRVTVLDLRSSQLTGSISQFLGNLSFLRLLNLENNSFSYAIPPQISNLRRIEHLLLENNSLVGDIPSNLSACSNLLTFRVGRNKLDGVIPVELGSLSKLTQFDIGNNELTGGIPTSFGNMSSLINLYLFSNKLTGSIPSTLGGLIKLEIFAMADNMLSGTIPSHIFNLSNIVVFDVQINQLQGILPSYLGNTFTKLYFFGIGSNKFTGSIPLSLSNASELIKFESESNNFTGEIPKFINSGKLVKLILSGNQLGSGGKFGDLSFFPSLTNCTDLDYLALSENNLGGIFPESFLNLSTALRIFLIDNNHISGSIPSSIERFVNLVLFDMSNNRIIGTIPPDIGKLQNLQVLYLDQNHLSGDIPSSLGNLSSLSNVFLADNHLKGNIPSSLGNCQSLNELSFSGNNISGPIPLQIFGILSLTILLDLSENRLTGSLPYEVGELKNLKTFIISNNLLSGNIPSALSSCLLLEELDMEGNLFQGKIPSSLSALRGLQLLSLARNNLSGTIPHFFGELKLEYLDLSFNDFEGEVPTKGIFKNASAVFVNGNRRLCGGVPELKLHVCISRASKKKSRSSTYKVLVPTILGLLGLTLMLCLFFLCWFRKRRPRQILESSNYVHFRMSYQALITATDGFSSANIIGSGGFGTVYRGSLEDGRLIAVKVLNLEHRAAAKSFIAECEAMRNIRHRNLVKLLTVCSGIDYQGNDFKAVVYEFMVNGNLDEWLHLVPTEDTDQHRHNMNLLDRLSIAIDVATALNYLHNDCQPPIVHCDIKPSNILLDNEMTAHVGDFGLARFIIKRDNNDAIQTSTGGVRGSIGYTPPEYGLGSEMSTAGDVYSFGILLLEMMTGKRPTDSMFQEGHNLHHFAQMSLPNKVTDILDNVLLQDNEECLISAVKIGVACSLESPKDRMRTSDVFRELNVLKGLLLSRHN